MSGNKRFDLLNKALEEISKIQIKEINQQEFMMKIYQIGLDLVSKPKTNNNKIEERFK